MKNDILETFELEMWELIEHAHKRGCLYIDLLKFICKAIPDLVQKAYVDYKATNHSVLS